jgi:hypothetical protein
MEYYFVTFSDGDTALMSHVPGVMSMSIAPEDGVYEVSRDLLPDMTQDEFNALMKQAATNRLSFDTLKGKVITEPKMIDTSPTTAEGATN